MYEHINPVNGQEAPLVSEEFYQAVMEVGATGGKGGREAG